MLTKCLVENHIALASEWTLFVGGRTLGTHGCIICTFAWWQRTKEKEGTLKWWRRFGALWAGTGKLETSTCLNTKDTVVHGDRLGWTGGAGIWRNVRSRDRGILIQSRVEPQWNVEVGPIDLYPRRLIRSARTSARLFKPPRSPDRACFPFRGEKPGCPVPID